MNAPDPAAGPGDHRRRVQTLGLWLGPLAALVVYAWLAQSDAASLTHAGKATAAVGILMALWWLTEALPLPATALLPLALFPLLGISDLPTTATPYAKDIIFLFMGGFMLGLAMERWGLHKRIALRIILATGTGPRRLVAGFMIATAAMSMWISNTATTIILLPVAQSVVTLMLQNAASDSAAAATSARRFATCLVLSIAYSASIGGSGSLIGSPPNLVVAGYAEQEFGCSISVLDWMRLGLPAVAILLPLSWLYLTRVAFRFDPRHLPCGRAQVRGELEALGPMNRGERIVSVIFAVTALLWILRPQLAQWLQLPGLSDAGIAMVAALVLFIVPVQRGVAALDWETAIRLPWGILLLFGGGLSLASAIATHDVDRFIAGGLSGFEALSPFVLLAAVATLVVFATELSSNTATATAFAPILAAVAVGFGTNPLPVLFAVGLGANYAFMMPVATPPNAIVFGSGRVQIGDMVRTGMALNVIALFVIVGLLSILPLPACPPP